MELSGRSSRISGGFGSCDGDRHKEKKTTAAPHTRSFVSIATWTFHPTLGAPALAAVLCQCPEDARKPTHVLQLVMLEDGQAVGRCC